MLKMPIVFVDAHARLVALDGIAPGYMRGDGDFGGGSHHLMDFPYGLHTVRGVRGADTN
jgi:hypothetical protein